MARILFGVLGDAWGHVNQALAIAQEMNGHHFLFLGDERALFLNTRGYSVKRVPMFSTRYKNNRVDIPTTLRNASKVLQGLKTAGQRAVEIARAFDPDLVLTAYEYFAPLAARKLKKPCFSIDNQHFLTKCNFRRPEGQILSRLMFTLPLKIMYSRADKYFINAFFQLPPKNTKDTEVFPPLLRKAVRGLEPREEGHVLVYQTSPSFLELLKLLGQIPCRFIVYGFNARGTHGNIIFRPPSNERFLRDLASCRYVITNGGQNVIAEALYFGKPVLSFPIFLAYEQFFNAHMLAAMGYGDYCLDPKPDLSILINFENRLDGFRSRIARGDFLGNKKLADRLEEVIQSL